MSPFQLCVLLVKRIMHARVDNLGSIIRSAIVRVDTFLMERKSAKVRSGKRDHIGR